RHAATTLSDGRALVAGGADAGFNPSDSAEIYDPVSNTWSATGSMATKRQGQTATRLANGKVLGVAGIGGTSQARGTPDSAELSGPARPVTWKKRGSGDQ